MLLSPELYFSYSQFLVYDEVVERSGLLWTKKHVEQGFARQYSTVCFATLLEYGTAIVSVIAGAYVPGDYQRVIAVPFQAVSGVILVEGPESDIDRKVVISPGHYRLLAAQSIVNNDDENGEERIALFFESVDGPLKKSHVLVADKNLSPSETLLENAETA